MEGGVVGDHLGGQERETDDDQQERVQEWAGDEQTRPEKWSWVKCSKSLFATLSSVFALTYFRGTETNVYIEVVRTNENISYFSWESIFRVRHVFPAN